MRIPISYTKKSIFQFKQATIEADLRMINSTGGVELAVNPKKLTVMKTSGEIMMLELNLENCSVIWQKTPEQVKPCAVVTIKDFDFDIETDSEKVMQGIGDVEIIMQRS